MKKNYFLLAAFALFTLAQAQSVPEILYYKFNTGTTIPNQASNPPVGTANATIAGTGLTVGGTALSGTGLVGTGTVSTTDYVNTGWVTSLSGSWTIGFYTANVPASTTLFYIFGDNTAGAFRCFTNGVAAANNWMLRATGMPDIVATGGAVLAPRYIHFVYDSAAAQMRSYVNGVFSNSAPVVGNLVISGTQFKVGAYAANSNLSGIMDEFRIYDRALTPAEILATWNISLGTCASADSLAAANTDCHQVDLSWVSDTSVQGSVIEYGPVGFTPGTGTIVSASSNPFTLTGLAAAQSYHVYVSDSCGSSLSLPTGPVVVTTLPVPTADFSYQLFQSTINWVQYNFNATPSTNANAYTWYFGDGTSDTAKIVSHQYLQNGPVTPILVAHNDCGSDSLSINLVINNISIEDNTLGNVRLFPNPATNVLQIEGLNNAATTIILTDALGKLMYQAEEEGEKHTVDLTHLASGIYFVELRLGSKTTRTKIVKL